MLGKKAEALETLKKAFAAGYGLRIGRRKTRIWIACTMTRNSRSWSPARDRPQIQPRFWLYEVISVRLISIDMVYFWIIMPSFRGVDVGGECFMRFSSSFRIVLPVFVLLTAVCAGSWVASAQAQSKTDAGTKGKACPSDDSGLKLPAGFCASVFADDIGHARHLVVRPTE